jgi:hypothetical protein
MKRGKGEANEKKRRRTADLNRSDLFPEHEIRG